MPACKLDAIVPFQQAGKGRLQGTAIQRLLIFRSWIWIQGSRPLAPTKPSSFCRLASRWQFTRYQAALALHAAAILLVIRALCLLAKSEILCDGIKIINWTLIATASRLPFQPIATYY